MAILSISAAARAAGVHRSTLQRKILAGEVSTTTLPNGSRGVDTAELIRVFGELKGGPDATEPHTLRGVAARQSATGADAAAREREIALLREQLAAALEREQRLLRMLEEQQVRLLPAPKHSLLDRLVELVERLRQRG